MACIVTACIVMACIVGLCRKEKWGLRFGSSESAVSGGVRHHLLGRAAMACGRWLEDAPAKTTTKGGAVAESFFFEKKKGGALGAARDLPSAMPI